MSLYEQSPPPPAPPGYQAEPPPPPRGTSGLAIAGFILAIFIAPIGFILSLIAIFKTGAGRAKGRGLAVTGVIISVILMAGFIGGAVWISQQKLFDPGCVAGKAAMLKTPDNADPAALQSIADELKAAEAKAKHDDVRQALHAVAEDYAQLVTVMKTGEAPPGMEEKITADGAKIDELCTFGG